MNENYAIPIARVHR